MLTKPLRARGATAAAGDHVKVVESFLNTHRGVFRHGAEALAGARTLRDYTTDANGVRTMVWQQQLDGVRVFESTLQAHVTAAGELVNVSSRMLADAAAAAQLTAPQRAARLAAPAVTARQAVALAGKNLREEMAEADVTDDGAAEGAERRQKFLAPALAGATAELRWLPMNDSTLRLCWEVVTAVKSRGEMFRVLIDAQTGEAVVRQGLTNYFTDASYRVYTSDSPSPLSPGLATPLSTQPPILARTLVTTPALNATASPNGWIDDGVNETRGNNVDAHLDLNADNVADLPRPQGAPNRVFDFPLDLAQAPSANRDAAVTQLFYLCNWMHDKLYALGFTEASGNFQNNNFGRGGTGNDAVQADAQDGSGTNNANFSTPADGSPGRMQMYVFTGPTPDRDGDFDAEIVLHEYTHGLSNRLVGGGVGISALQSQGMGEGWSDFYGLALLSEAGDNVNGNYAAGGYATYQLSATFTQNYYYGIRRYPYSTDLTKNPLTFKDIDPAQFSAHAGIPASPVVGGGGAAEVHNQGEVWCATLWEARANLINKFGFATGNQLILQLVTDGMKLAPANPTFLQARDAIIQADAVLNGGANRGELWTAFAKRGMGSGATSPASSTTTGVVESYAIPDNLGVTPTAVAASAGTIGGPFTPFSFSYLLVNSGAAPLAWTAVDNQPWLDLSLASGTLAAGASVTVTATLNAAANALLAGSYAATLTFTNATSGLAQQRTVALTAEPFRETVFAENFEAATLGSWWTITGTNTHRTLLTTANGPHGGAQHLTMDSSVDNSYSRNEATLTLNLAGRQNLTLQFWVKMFNEEADGPPLSPFPAAGADFDGVAISADGGVNWYEVQPLRTYTAVWQQLTVDLDAALAARGLAYTANFKIRFNHYDNYTITTDGFAFDDILVSRIYTNSLALTLPAALDENAAPASATLTVVPPPAANLTVTLTSSRPGALAVPATVVVPAGQGSVTFQVTPVDDALLNGTRSVTVTAAAATYVNASGAVAVQDNENATLTLALPSGVMEGDTGRTGTLTMSGVAGEAVTVALASGDTAELTVPATVVIPAGQSGVVFPLTIIDDNRIDGPQSVTVTGQVAGWTTGSAVLVIGDNETTTLSVTLPAMREGDTGKTGTVTIPGMLPAPLTVALTSSDTTEATVPVSVTIPAGQTGATFVITVVDDTIVDGAQPVTVTATAAGFTAGAATDSVADNEAHHFSVAVPAGPYLRNALIAVTVTALDVNGAVITNFTGPVPLSALGEEGVMPLTPAVSGAFVNGVWTGNVAVGAYGSGVAILAATPGGQSGQSAPFEVVLGPLHHFAWSTVGTPQSLDAPFAATVTAADIAGNVVVNFNGSADLAARLPSTAQVQVLTWIGYADTTGTGEYVQTKQAISTFFTNYAETSTAVTDPAALAAALVGKHVFLVPEQETVPAGTMGTLGTAWAAVLTNFVNGGGTVIVCSWTLDEHLLLVNSGLLTATKGAAPSSLSVTKTADTALNAGVATPFAGSYISTYTGTNGTVSLQSATDGNPVVLSRSVGAGRAIIVGTDFFTLGTGLDRIVANAVSTAAVLGSSGLVAVRPAVAAFSAGVWAGGVSVPFVGIGLRLFADDHAGHTAESNAFNVVAFAPPAGSGVTVTLPATATEGAGSLTGSVALAAVRGTSLTLSLVSGAPAKVTVPATVTVPAGQLTASFAFQVLDDALIEGPKTVQISASAAGGLAGTGTIQILDNDLATLTLALPASLSEGGVAGTGTVTVNGSLASPLTVALSSSDPTTTVPATVTIALGKTSATFALTALNDNKIEGPLNAVITASVPGWTSVSASVLVQDDENFNLTVTLPASLREGDTGKTGTVNLSGVLAANLTVALLTSDATEATVPASVTIPAGQTSATFPLTVIDDPDADGPQPVTITASAAGFVNGSASGSVADNDAHHFTFGPIGSPQVKNGPLPAVVTARDAANAVLTDYNSAIALTATGDSGALAVTPATASAFVNGVWTGSVQINALAANVVLTASDTGGHTGASNAFDLVAGNLDHFAWEPVPPLQTVDTPFSVTVRAVDAGNGTVTAYNGVANFSVLTGLVQPPVGTGTSSLYLPLSTYSHDSRTQIIYAASELGGPARITALAFYIDTLSNEVLTNFTVRLKHTATASFTTAVWDNAGWTTVYRASPTVAATGWMTFTFTTPFDYDGTSGLMVDYSMDRTASASTYTYVRGTGSGLAYVQVGTSDSLNGDPLTWTAATPYPSAYYSRPNVQLTTVQELPIRPAQSSAFSSGVWTGLVSVPVTGTGLALRARAGSFTGTGSSFTVAAPGPAPDGGNTVLAEDFESGVLGSAWTITGTGNYRTQNTATNTPHAGTRHLTMDDGVYTGAYARNEATLTLNLAGRTGVQLQFWAVGYNEVAHGPPAAPFPGTGADFDGVAVSADGGVNWYEVQPLRPLTNAYTQYTVNLDAALAARGLSYSSNFKIRFNQYGYDYLPFNGIGIDDILITATPASGFSIAVPAQATEGAGGLTGSVTLDAVRATAAVFALSSSAPAKAAVPASVTIPAGQLSASFALTVPDDTLLDGSRTAVITATLPAVLPRSAPIVILDNDTAALAITAPASAVEGATGLTGSVSLGTVPVGPITVNLSSSDPSAATVPATVAFAVGQTLAPFAITAVDDSKIDGTQTAVLTASVPGWTPATTAIQILDNETRTLTLSPPSSVYEGATATGSVYLSGTLPTALVVTLTSANPAQLTVPASVTIPAGSTSASFVATGVDDTLFDGAQTVAITATAATFTGASGNTVVYDNDVHHFTFGSIAASQVANQPFAASVSARDVNSVTITSYNGAVNLTASGAAGALVVAPAVVTLSSGSWSGTLAITAPGTGVAVTATAGTATGVSNSFAVGVGAADHLSWSAIPVSQTAGVAFTATVAAKDAFENTVPTVTGAATLSAGPPSTQTGIGTVNSVNLFESSPQERHQVIYQRAEVGAAGQISSLAMQVYVYTGGTLTNATVRMKHTALADFSTSAAWQSTGWTTVFQGSLTLSSAATAMWVTIPLTAPFQYDGTSNLMVDISHNGGATHGHSIATTRTALRTLHYWGSGFADPLTWTGTTNPSPSASSAAMNLRLGFTGTVPVGPASVTLANGTWTGPVAVQQAATGIILKARIGAGLAGDSNAFNVAIPPVPTLAVSPADGLAAAGARGGPFTPAGKVFTLSNPGVGTVAWTAVKTATWLDLSATSGTLAPGASSTVTASLNAAANALAAGSFTGTLTFTNTTNGVGNTTRPVALTASPFGVLTVAPTAGGNYTLGNSGDAPLDWTLANSAPWLTALPLAGTLAPAATATVAVAPNALAGQLTPGHYASPLSFTNATTGRGSMTFTPIFEVLLPAPAMQPEPPVTGGLFNTVAWLPVAGATSYEAQAATVTDFTGAPSSGFIAGLTHTFGPLLDGQAYYYRVRSGALLPLLSGWTQSTPADLATGTKANVTLDATGIVLTNTPGGPIAGRIQNPGFDSETSGETGPITGWTRNSAVTGLRACEAYGTGYPSTPPMPTTGTNYLLIYTFEAGTHNVGDFVSATQTIDFTGSASLQFDHRNTVFTAGTWSNSARAEVRIDGTTVWSAAAEGSNLNQSVNAGAYTGLHAVELREQVVTAGAFKSQWILFDNLRLNGLGGYPATGTLLSPTITATPARWGQVFFETDKPAGTTLTVDVLDAANVLLATNLANGTDLGAIPALTGRPALRLRANLGTASVTATPRLRKWAVTWTTSTDSTPAGGAWSNVVTSTQDATAPQVAIVSSADSALAFHVIAGTASDTSGIDGVTINGVPAETTDRFAHWRSPQFHLAPGPNAFTIAIADRAAPANTATTPTSVTFTAVAGDLDGDGLPDAWELAHGLDPADDGWHAPGQGAGGDLDGDGLPNLFELALGLDPTVPDPDARPWQGIEKNPADNRDYLVFSFRRPFGSSAYVFAPEVCGALSSGWSSAAALIQEISATPAGDGLTETAKVRILPALDAPGGAPRFIRLRVTQPVPQP